MNTRNLILGLLLALSGCNSDTQFSDALAVPPGPQKNTPSVAASSIPSGPSGPTAMNSIIDLTVPAAQEPQTDVHVFDESLIFAPNFAINQNDPTLSDLFDATGESNLCFPTALAEDLIDLMGYHNPKFSNLQLAGLSQDRNQIDPNALIRQLFTLCKTDPSNGTAGLDGLKCALSLLSQSGYSPGNTQLISPFYSDPTLPVASRELTISDIRSALKGGNPIILEAAWFTFDAATQQWTRSGGHYISVYGYDYDLNWGENLIQLKVINPETNYGSSRQYALWDTITVERISPQAGVTYPANRPFTLSGSGFGGSVKRAFLGEMLEVAPSTP